MRAVLLVVAACGPAVTYDTPKDQPTAPKPNPGAATSPGDESFALTYAIEGKTFAPLVLDTYGVSGAMPPKKTTLDAERKAFAAAKTAVDVQVHATYLATMLYVDDGDHKANLVEARDALQAAVTKAGPKDTDELTLQLLARYQMLTGDYASADKTWEQFMTMFPKDKEIELARAFAAFVDLRLGNTVGARDMLGGIPDKLPEVQYALAWTRWRSGDAAGARDLMRKVVAAWGNDSDKEKSGAIRKEATLFAVRADGGVADADARDAVFVARALGEAGRWKDAIDATDKAGGDKFDVLAFTRPLGDPDAIAKAATAAFTGCGAPCKREREVADVALAIHNTYSVSADPRYYQAAHDLYAFLLPKLQDATLRKTVGDYSGNLEATKAGLKPGKGHLDQPLVDRIVAEHKAEIEACYVTALVTTPALHGTLAVKLDIAQAGTVAATADGVDGVAACVTDRAKGWHFPARGSAGSTHVTINYTLTPRGAS